MELATLRHQKRKQQIIKTYALESPKIEKQVEDIESDDEGNAKVPSKTRTK